MASFIQKLGCPNCGAPYKEKSRSCGFCGSALIVTSIAQTFGRSMEANKVSESLAKWRQRIKDDPDNAEAHYALGLTYLNSKLRDAALVHLRKAVRLAPEMADAHFNLALTLFNDGKVIVGSSDEVEAVSEINCCVQLAPEFPEALAFKHSLLANKLSAVDIEQTLAEYKRAIEACSDIPSLHRNLGMCYEANNNLVEAESSLQRAIDIDPSVPYAHSRLCRVMYNQGKYQQAIEMGMKSVALDNNDDVAHNYLSLCLDKLDRLPEALEHATKALAIEPTNSTYAKNVNIFKSRQAEAENSKEAKAPNNKGSKATIVRYALALFLPFAFFFSVKRPIAGILCLIWQISLYLWIPAAIWAFYACSQLDKPTAET